MSNYLSNHMRNAKEHYLGHILTFFVYLTATLCAGYLVGHGGTAPAVLFAVDGIALAAFIILGYTAAVPVALASFIGAMFNGDPLLIVLATTLGGVIQPTIALFVLRKLGFHRKIETTRDLIILMSVSGLTSMIAPTINVNSVSLFNANIGTTTTFSLMHLWVATLLSCVILTPFILRWTAPFAKRTFGEWIEVVVVMLLFVAINYTVAFYPISVIYGVSLTIPFFALPMWIALRAGPRFVTLTMVIAYVTTVSGLLLGDPAVTASSLHPIPQQVYSTQIWLIFIALFFYILSTIEERRRLAVRELARHTQNLEYSLTEKEMDDDAKNEFIAVLGHEIRNPLAAILSSAELLKVSKDEAQRERLVESIEDRIRSVARLLDDIFDISRITRRKLHLKKELLRARSVLRGAVESVESYMRKNGHQFTVTLPDKNVLIEADPVRIEQIITNLLYNAAKYTPSGGMIDFKGAYESGPSNQPGVGQLVIRVRDTGVGLSEEEQERVFEPFMQINPKQSLMGGVGLGLTLAKNLAEMHSGTIEVQSDGAGRGSEFIVRLPARIGDIPVKKEPEALPKPTPDSTKILVVDDNVDAARGMGKLLELHGHEVEIAYNGSEALEKAKLSGPHGIILDIGLPDIDGYEVARRLREAGNNSILIALSGYGHEDHKKKGRDAGFDFFLTKPVSITEVVRIVNGNSKKAPPDTKKRGKRPLRNTIEPFKTTED